jgi:hypothetical protein
MSAFKDGADVWVDFDGAEWPGEVLKTENSGYVRCTIHVDPEWDFGFASARVMPVQTVAVWPSRLRPREAGA